MGQQNSCKTLIGVHSTMHFMHRNQGLALFTCHPSPSNSQQETTDGMSHVTVVVRLLLTLDYYQECIMKEERGKERDPPTD